MNTTSQHSSEEEPIPKNYRNKIAQLISTMFGLGYFPIGPGTVASLVTVIFWSLPIFFGLPAILILVAGAVLFLVGIWASEIARKTCINSDDPSEIVIDEVAGQTIALAFVSGSLVSIFASFLLFRVLDIVKPGPIGWLDRKIKGGLGIMLDDLAAGLLVLPLNLFLRYFA